MRFDQLDNPTGDFTQPQHFVRGAEIDRYLGHTEDDARGFVLGDGWCTSLFHLEQTLGPVAAHARKDDADSVASCGLGH